MLPLKHNQRTSSHPQKLEDMASEVGKYFFRKRYTVFYIYQYDVVEEGFESAKHISSVQTYDEAVKEVYRLNGWGEPKQIKRFF